MDAQEVEQDKPSEPKQSVGEMDDNKYLQLSISALITAVVIGLGLYFRNNELDQDSINLINYILLAISILIGAIFLYKHLVNDSKTRESGWVNNLVEKVSQVLPQIGLVPLIVSVIIVTQFFPQNSDDETPTVKVTEWTVVHTVEVPGPTTVVTIIVTASPSETVTLTPTVSPTPSPTFTSTPTPQKMGCVISTGLNVRDSPGVGLNPSNHKQLWLQYGDCVIILKEEIILFNQQFSQRWAFVEIIQEGGKSFTGWVRLSKGNTAYVITATPSVTPSPTASQP